MKILILGLGYVGTANAVLLSQQNEVVCYDLNVDRINLINNKKSPIEDKEASEYLSQKNLNLKGVVKFPSQNDFDFVVIATPTNYDPDTNNFDTSTVESSIENLISQNSKATIIIRSTLPVGFIERIQKKYSNQEIIFIPEFLREGKALHDSLYPSRIIVGSHCQSAENFATLLKEGAKKDSIETLFMRSAEAEAVKLFSNTYLAMRVSFFNELDSFSLTHDLNTESIIDGVCLDERIGKGYNNPSFGYGGYCLPKDTKQLLANYEKVPQTLIEAIVSSNSTRKDFIANEIIKMKPEVVGLYRLVMKEGSDNFRSSAIQDVMKRIKSKGIKVILHEPSFYENEFFGSEVLADVNEFITKSDLIVANRISNDLKHVQHKIFTRDIFREN